MADPSPRGVSESPRFVLETSINTLNKLATEQDEGIILDNIELVADAIDIILYVIEKNKSHTEFIEHGVLEIWLTMLKSPCDQMVQLALSGLERILSVPEVAVHGAKVGAFEALSNVIVNSSDDHVYEKTKASDALCFLMAPPDCKYLKTLSLKHKVFDEHIRLTLHDYEKFTERGVQFLWCITDKNRDAQEKVANIKAIYPKLEQAIQEADVGRSAVRLIHNLSRLDNAKRVLPVSQITSLLKPILSIPDEYMAKKDKWIAAVTIANFSEPDRPVDRIIIKLLESMAVEILDGSFQTLTLSEVTTSICTIAANDTNKQMIADSSLIRLLLDIIQLKESTCRSKKVAKILGPVKSTVGRALLILVMHEQCREKMKADGAQTILQTVSNVDPDDKIKKNCKDILSVFQLREHKSTNNLLLQRLPSSPNMSRSGSGIRSSPGTPASPLANSDSSIPSPRASPNPSPSPRGDSGVKYGSAVSSTTSVARPSPSPAPVFTPPKPATTAPKFTPPAYTPPSPSPAPAPTPASPVIVTTTPKYTSPSPAYTPPKPAYTPPKPYTPPSSSSTTIATASAPAPVQYKPYVPPLKASTPASPTPAAAPAPATTAPASAAPAGGIPDSRGYVGSIDTVRAILKGTTPAPFPEFDKKRAEQYLSDDDFKTLIGMSKESFYSSPGWRQDPIRRKARLF